MDISFANKKLQKTFNDQKRLTKEHGALQAKLINKRLHELRAADNLEIISTLPQARCHELQGERKGTLSVDLNQPYRLFFQPVDDPIPLKDDGGLDWKGVKSIMILGVGNPHG